MKNYQYRRRGFTLFEVSVALSIGITALLAFTPYYLKIMERGLIEQTAYRAKMVYEGAINYYIDNNQWPTDTAALSSGNYIIGRAAQTSWGDNISVGVIAADNSLALTFTVHKVGIANSIAAKLPTASVDSNLQITEVILPPMANAAFATKADLNLLQDLAGTRAWAGSYHASGHDLRDIHRIYGKDKRNEDGEITHSKFSAGILEANGFVKLGGHCGVAFNGGSHLSAFARYLTEHNSIVPVYCNHEGSADNLAIGKWRRLSGLDCKVCIACSDGNEWRMAACDEADDDGWAISNKQYCANAGNLGIKFVCGPDSSEGFPIAKYRDQDGTQRRRFYDIDTNLQRWPFEYYEDSAVLNKNKD